ncbi:MAG: YciI family protein [Pseudomonadales bacterium]|nr:YciI family protein [Pseudomonadales bacterium]MEE2891158.1 YciI family protein [Pseudomonadota bacterium]
MLYALYCRDGENATDLRAANREAHLAYARSVDCIRAAGPLLSDDGEVMIGSLFIIEAEDMAAVDRFREADPYVQAGLFTRVDVHPFRWTVGSVPAP